jgi:hypothetical protein
VRKVLNLECAYIKSKIGVMWGMIRSYSKKRPDRVKNYIRENWGAPFIVGFMSLLLIAAVSLAIGLPVLADGIAIVAYFALVAGVFLQLVCFLKYNTKIGEAHYDSS